MNCRHCKQPIIFREGFAWIHEGREGLSFAMICNPNMTTCAAPDPDANIGAVEE